MIKGKKSSLSKRYQTSYETKESGGGTKSGVMNWKLVDGEINFFSPVEGKNRINIIPYEIKTKNHPLVKKGEMEIGDKDYVMDIFTHRSIGPSEATVICLKSTYGKPCPICEHSALLRKEGKEDEAKDLKPSRRVFYNVEDLKNPGELKVFEASHYLFEKELIDEARDDEEGGFVDFADEKEGKEIKFRASEVVKGSMKYKEFKSFGFEDRDEEISDELLDSAISFDEILNVPTYEEVEKILFGQDDDEEDDEKPSKKNRDEDEDDDEEEEEEKPAKKSKRYDDDDDDDEEDEEKHSKKKSHEDEEDEEKPSKKNREDDDDDDEKPAKKSCDKDCLECPFGYEFGKDCEKSDECDDCDIWDKCIKEHKNRK